MVTEGVILSFLSFEVVISRSHGHTLQFFVLDCYKKCLFYAQNYTCLAVSVKHMGKPRLIFPLRISLRGSGSPIANLK